ncbi:MAG: glycosyltransferase [Candidatus Omnitrophica bacterium]|jgi:glycosyltransferase involved in cell wall biosynthesis|nr:glycosyltransferase [Candidatus Omnitrophota bacterium]
MKILHITPNFESKLGGVPKVVFEMTKSLNQKGIDIVIFSSANKADKERTFFTPNIPTHICQRGFLSRFWTAYSSDAIRILRREIKNCDLVHIHEVWHYLHYAGYRIAKEFRKPYGVSIHGELSSWCLGYKGFRKKIYSQLLQKKILKEAFFLQAIITEEAKDILSYSGNKNIFIIPNGIEVSDNDLSGANNSIAEFPDLKNKKVILFLGRLDPKKGLDLLAKAWGQIAKNREDLALVIAGPDAGSYKKKIMHIFEKEGVMNKVIFLGMVESQKKAQLFKRTDMVVIPSYSEVRTLVALEAMAYSKPVIITDKCHFSEIGDLNAGLVIKLEVKSLVEAINKLLMNPKLGEEMGHNGKKLVLNKYTWDRVSDQIIHMYNSVLSKDTENLCQHA